MNTLRDIIPARYRGPIYTILAIAVVIVGRWAGNETARFITDLAAATGFGLAAANINQDTP